MRWFRRKAKPKAAVPDGQTPGPYAAYWWRPGCTCHWSAGVDEEYCDFCLAEADRRVSSPPAGGDA